MFNLKDVYYAYPSGVTKKICKEIISQGLIQNNQKGTIGGIKEVPKNKKTQKKLNKIRNSNVSWFNYFWIYKELRPFIWASNQAAGWKYSYDNVEHFQFTIYDSKEKQHYDWHSDSSCKDLNREGLFNNKCRKLSTVVFLNDPSEYEGGDLEFQTYKPSHEKGKKIMDTKEIKKQGTIITFPSFDIHRVTPVTKGIRNSLVMWNNGDAFK